MAKGNDENYLQHCVEVEAAGRLTQVDAQGRVHIALVHGMEPCESFEASKCGQIRRLTLPPCARNAVEIDAATFAQMSRGLVRTDHRDIESDRDQGETRWDLWDL